MRATIGEDRVTCRVSVPPSIPILSHDDARKRCMALAIHLLGTPSVEHDGHVAPRPRGRKLWALLAYLVLADHPPSRRRLAELLFADADDPLGALRWNLAQLRRMLGEQQALAGDPVALAPSGADVVDVTVLMRGSWRDALALPGLGRELLEGLDVPGSPAFEAWLLIQRRHLQAATEAVLREGVLATLAEGDAARAAALAARLVEQNPLDEGYQELFVRSLAAAGDRDAATRQLESATELLERELGVRPGPALLAAADLTPGERRSPHAAAPATVAVQIEAGAAAAAAGAFEAAVARLRGAVSTATRAGHAELQARALTVLGSTLVHAARGRDEEGAGALHSALALIGDREPLALTARRELAWIEMLRGRYDRSLRWIDGTSGHDGASPADPGDAAEPAWVAAVRGICLTDIGHLRSACVELEGAVTLAQDVGAARAECFALAFLGRARLLAGDLEPARAALQPSLDLARRLAWASFLPLPEAFLAEVDRLEGDLERAERGFEHALTLAIELDDPCWEGLAARGMALCEYESGRVDDALARLSDASVRCVRVPDAYLWVQAWCLDALAGLGVATRAPAAGRWVARLESLAARTGMREMSIRALRHRAALGDERAGQAAGVLAVELAEEQS